MIYEVYCDDNLICSTKLDEKDRRIFNANIELELNKTGSFYFDIYPRHPHYNALHKLKSILTVWRNNALVFRGRILNEEQGFYNEKQVICEGELAFLLDSVIRPYTFKGSPEEYLRYLIDEHNSQVDKIKQFKVGIVTVTDGDTSNDNNEIDRSNTDYKTTWDLISEKLIDSIGGYLWPRHEVEDGELVTYIDYLNKTELPQNSNQPIEFGKNLLDLKKVCKGEDVLTGIIPLGSKDNDIYVTIKGATDAEGNVVCEEDYLIDEQAAASLGRIFKTVQWEDVTDSYNLWKNAKEYLKKAVAFSTSIEFTAADLAGISDVDPFHLGQRITIKDDRHGLEGISESDDGDITVFVEKLSLDIFSPANNKLTAGATFSTFTQSSNSTAASQNKIAEKVSKLEGQMSSDLKDYYQKKDADEKFATKDELTTATEGTASAIEGINNSLLGMRTKVTELEGLITGLDERIKELEGAGEETGGTEE